MWERLVEAGGPQGVQPSLLRELGIYGGAQGIWVDKQQTKAAAPATGVAVGLLNARGALGKLILIFPPVDAAEACERWSRFCDVVRPEWRDLLPPDAQAVLMVRFPSGSVPEFVTCKWRGEEGSYRLALRYGAAARPAPKTLERGQPAGLDGQQTAHW